MANILYPLLYGPTGRDLVVDASGRLVATGDTGTDRYILGYGGTGRSMVVDASGRLILSSLSPGLTPTSVTNLAVNGVISQPWERILTVVNGSQTIDMANANRFDVNLDNDTTLTLSNEINGAKYTFLLTQASGNNTVGWESRVEWVGGLAPTITAASGSQDIVSLIYNSRLNTFFANVDVNIS